MAAYNRDKMDYSFSKTNVLMFDWKSCCKLCWNFIIAESPISYSSYWDCWFTYESPLFPSFLLSNICEWRFCFQKEIVFTRLPANDEDC